MGQKLSKNANYFPQVGHGRGLLLPRPPIIKHHRHMQGPVVHNKQVTQARIN